nr:aminopeptidase M1 [Tanacetum cinerariifolium]
MLMVVTVKVYLFHEYIRKMLLEEMASIFLTLFLLIFLVPEWVDDILEFIQEYTLDVEGVGHVTFKVAIHRGNQAQTKSSSCQHSKTFKEQKFQEHACSSFKYEVVEEKLNGNLKIVSYQKSPIMSTYLVVAVVGLFDYVEDRTPDGIKVRVYCQVEKANQGKFALDVAVKTLGLYKEYASRNI